MYRYFVRVTAVVIVAMLAGYGFGHGCARTEEGLPSSFKRSEWMPVAGDGGVLSGGFGSASNFASRGIACYNGDLYVGTQNADFSHLNERFGVKPLCMFWILTYCLLKWSGSVAPLLQIAPFLVPVHSLYSQGCEIWRYSERADAWAPVVSDASGAMLPAGFGTARNFAASVVQPFKEALYVGTSTSSLRGCEIWRFDGSAWKRVADRGLGDRHNSGIWSSTIFRGHLYVGTMNWKHGCQIYRSRDGRHWDTVRQPGGPGFGTRANVYAWSMGVYRGRLYVGTCNLQDDRGAELWRYDGCTWEHVGLPGGDGFGDPANYGIRSLLVFRDELYVGTTASFAQRQKGAELWRYNGRRWTPVVGDSARVSDGFGDPANKWMWSMQVVNDELWVGTLNVWPALVRGPLSSDGCEIWRYNGWWWRNVVGAWRGEMPGGFDDRGNVGARSMLEYPPGSGTIYIGTWYFDLHDYEDFSGCELWKRTPSDDRYTSNAREPVLRNVKDSEGFL